MLRLQEMITRAVGKQGVCRGCAKSELVDLLSCDVYLRFAVVSGASELISPNRLPPHFRQNRATSEIV